MVAKIVPCIINEPSSLMREGDILLDNITVYSIIRNKLETFLSILMKNILLF